ncbi:MAG: hypothetical protein IPM63_05995 [Acidobacteriota bacterium]|nr:MAG: hypothetical protein IPM63_05995 [Acidobacteriota bacterium]
MSTFPKIALILALLAAPAFTQTAELRLTFNEQFFDALLEAVFTKLEPPSVSLASVSGEGFGESITAGGPSEGLACKEAVTLKKEIDGVRTAVRFRNGKIYAPIAFLGNYNPPLIGCIEFRGWAETNIELLYDADRKALVGNAKVLNVNLSGTGGVGGELIARMVQNSIDSRINPIEIVSMDKLSFTVPVKDSGSLRMNALGIRHQVADRALDVYIKYDFQKAK